ncbi:NAD(P)H-binding protein [Streptomyces sp. NPDC051172]|uniref:NAD(P)H-binding protein n=1 Tax=Streptomyces sp. NPDC051172 TaxID=3155796 RepID=UPI0034147848
MIHTLSTLPGGESLREVRLRLSNIKAGFEDHTGVDQVVRASSGIDWTLTRAVALTDKPLSGPLRAAETGTEKPGARINRADLAHFLVQTIEDDAWIRKAPLVWNTRG